MSEYPATISVETSERITNWRPIGQPILAIPHAIVAWALTVIGEAIAIVSWFAIMFTGRLPEGMASFQCMVIRYAMRVYAYSDFLHPTYPPFDFSSSATEPGGTPVAVDLVPSLDGRNRLTVGLRLFWMIPAALYAFVIAVVGGVCLFLAFWAVLFTGRWPAALQEWVMRMMRVSVRFAAYAYLLTDEYPPFSTD